MKRALTFVCLGASLWTAAWGQTPANAVSADAAPSAFVYVSATIGTTNRAEIYGFSGDASGRLTPVPGSPFAADVTFMAVNGLYLFGSDATGTAIHAFAIGADGALRYVRSNDVAHPNNRCDNAGALFFDHTGATLYNVDYYGGRCSDTVYQAFAVEKSNGGLRLVGEAGAGVNGTVLHFTGNNGLAVGAHCIQSDATIYGYARKGDGPLSRIESSIPFPARAPEQSWCPYLAAADPANHLAVAMYARTGDGQHGPFQLATYTLGQDGSIVTSSSSSDMPVTAVGDVTDMTMSPSGKLLAVAGTHGLQVFHFNGAGPITPYTGLLTRQEVDQMFWDNDDHLFAIGQAAGKLWSFTVTPSQVAAGSPVSVRGAMNIVVQPWPLPWSAPDVREAARPAEKTYAASVSMPR